MLFDRAIYFQFIRIAIQAGIAEAAFVREANDPVVHPRTGLFVPCSGGRTAEVSGVVKRVMQLHVVMFDQDGMVIAPDVFTHRKSALTSEMVTHGGGGEKGLILLSAQPRYAKQLAGTSAIMADIERADGLQRVPCLPGQGTIGKHEGRLLAIDSVGGNPHRGSHLDRS